jgi:hypothetical protein
MPAQWVTLDVAQDCEQMVVFLDGKSLESALPNVSAGFEVLMVPPHMGGLQPLHPAAKIAIFLRPEHQMEMIGHQAISQYPHGAADVCFIKQAQESGIVGRLMKHLLASVAAIEDVVTVAGRSNSLGTWHGIRR